MEFRYFDSLDERRFSDRELAEIDVLLVWHARITAYTAERLKKCRLVIRYGVGYDQVDGEALAARGIALANNPAYCTEEVADSAVAMLLGLSRNILRHNALARHYRGSWQEHALPSVRSRDRIVGLIGMGRIGTATALRLKAIGFRVIGYDPYQASGHEKAIGYERVDSLGELLAASDYVSVHCPLTPETEGMIDDGFLARMKPDAGLVSTARGKILASFDALHRHLLANEQFQAALDVLPQEPPPDHPLITAWREDAPWLAGRLTINPHNAFYSDASSRDMRYDVLKAAWDAHTAGIKRNIVNQCR